MWNSTGAMVNTMVETLLSEGIEVALYNLSSSDMGDIAKDLVDSRAIVLGTPTVLGGMHPVSVYALHLVKALRLSLRYGVALSSYGWGGGALRQAQQILESTKIEMVGVVEVDGPPTADDHQKIIELGRELSGKIKQTGD